MNLAQFYRVVCTGTADVGGCSSAGCPSPCHWICARQNSLSKAAVCQQEHSIKQASFKCSLLKLPVEIAG